MVNLKSYFVNLIHFTCSKNIIHCIIQLFLHFNSAGQNHRNDEKKLQILRGEQNVLKVICYYYLYLFVCFSLHCDDITFAFS